MISEAVKLNNSILTLEEWGDKVVDSVNKDANTVVNDDKESATNVAD